MSKKALLLIGSPKPGRSTSEVLGMYLIEELKKREMQTTVFKLNQIFKTDQGMDNLISSADECDVLILAAPLYVDSTPATVIRAMEVICQARKGKNQQKNQAMLAISNCGFPEAHQNQPALDIYRCFAKEAGFQWAGGLALGGGGSLDGKPLGSFGGMVKNVVKSLDLTVAAITEGHPIPDEAVRLMSKPLMPNWFYYMVGQIGWWFQARKYGAHRNLNDQPYED